MEITFNTEKEIGSLQRALLFVSFTISIVFTLLINSLCISKNTTVTLVQDIISFTSIFMTVFLLFGSMSGVILTYFMKNKRHVNEKSSILSYYDMKSNGSKTEALVLFRNRQKPIRISVDTESDIRVGNNFDIEYDTADTLFGCRIIYNIKVSLCA